MYVVKQTAVKFTPFSVFNSVLYKFISKIVVNLSLWNVGKFIRIFEGLKRF